MSRLPSDLLFAGTVIAATVAVIYAFDARSRSRARKAHEDALVTGSGSWSGRIRVESVQAFYDVKLGFIKLLLLESGVPVRIDVSSSGVRATLTSRLVRRQAGRVWDAPWSDVVGAVADAVGRKGFDRKLSTVPLTDVHVTIVGQSAQRFLEAWDLAPTPEEQAETTADEEADWQAFVREELGAHWRPGTAILTVRMAASDGLVESIARQARGDLLPER